MTEGCCILNVNLALPDFDGNAIDVITEKGADISLRVYEKEVVISANKEGFISLAKQMLYMAVSPIPSGGHVHFDNFLDEMKNSDFSLIIESLSGLDR